MTRTEMQKFRKVLEAMVIELGGSSRKRDAIAIEGSADEFDRMLRAAERDLAVHTLEAVSSRQREARAALQRMDHGSFGICEECDEAIAIARLKAVPWARYCITCQEEADLRRASGNARAAFALAA